MTPVFQLSELKRLYLNRIQELQDDVPALSLHSTRFKNKILSYFPQLQAHNEGRDVFLVCNKSVGSCLKLASQTQQDDQIILSKAASIVRKDILSTKCSPFSGTFTEKCQENSVTNSLITLVSMILYGANITDEANYLSQAGLSLSQSRRSVSMVSETRQPFIPSPEEFGWTRETSSRSICWKPKWLTLPPAADACRATIRCGCVKGCKGQCRCFKAELPCTKLCKCGGCFVLNEV